MLTSYSSEIGDVIAVELEDASTKALCSCGATNQSLCAIHKIPIITFL
jgi:hypothetical protein